MYEPEILVSLRLFQMKNVKSIFTYYENIKIRNVKIYIRGLVSWR